MNSIQVPVNGRAVQLGAFYDHGTDDIVASGLEERIGGKDKWIQPVTQDESPSKRVSFLIHPSDEFRTHLLGVPCDEPIDSWMKNLIRLQRPADSVQIIVRLVVFQRVEVLQKKSVFRSKLIELLDGGPSTNRSLINGIIYGAQSVLVLEQNLEDAQDELFLEVRSFFSHLLASEEPSAQYPAIFDRTRCSYHSDMIESPQQSVAFRRYLEDHLLPMLLDDCRINWTPQEMILATQDTAIHDRRLRSECNFAVLQKYVANVQQQVEQMVQDPFLERVLYAKDHIKPLASALTSLQAKLGQSVENSTEMLPATWQFFKDVRSLCFQTALLDEWLCRKRREIRRMKQLFGDTDLKIEPIEHIVRRSRHFQVFQVKIRWTEDGVISAMLRLTGQPTPHSCCQYEIATAPQEHFEEVVQRLRSLALQAKRQSDVYLGVTASYQWPDGTVATNLPLTAPAEVSPPRAQDVPVQPARHLLAEGSAARQMPANRPIRAGQQFSAFRSKNRERRARYNSRDRDQRAEYSPCNQPLDQQRTVTKPRDGLLSVTVHTNAKDPATVDSEAVGASVVEVDDQNSVGEAPKFEEGSNFTSGHKKDRRVRACDAFVDCSELYRNGRPSIYSLPVEEKTNESLPFRWFHVGQPNESVAHKTILLMGATGAGKSTLVDAMVNYILGVEWRDRFRFKIVPKEGDASQSNSRTRTITAYTLHHADGMKIPHSLTIIDTPGYGDTAGLTTDQEISDNLCDLFIHDEAKLEQVNAVCFVASSADARLTPTQLYVISSVLAIFGKDMADSIRLLATFADGATPPVVEACRQAGHPFFQDSNESPQYAKFNNSVVFASNRPDGTEIDRMFWDMATNNFVRFFEMLSKMEAKSLEQTRDVIRKRMQLDGKLKMVQQRLEESLDKIHELQTAVKDMDQRKEAQGNASDSKPPIKPKKIRTTFERGWTALNCKSCEATCHPKKKLTKNERKKMQSEPCACKCPSAEHEFQNWSWECKEHEDDQSSSVTSSEEVDKCRAELESTRNDMPGLLLAEMDELNCQLEKMALRHNGTTTEDSIKMLQDRLTKEMTRGYQVKVDLLSRLLDQWKSGETF